MNAPIAPPAGAPAQQPMPMLHDCVIQRKKTAARAKVVPVPPEEFGVSRFTRNMRECNYAFHRPYVTEAQLIAQGYDEDQVKALPSATGITQIEEIDRDLVNEHQYASDSANTAQRQVDIIEHYCRFDYEGDGEPKLYKVTAGAVGGEILRKAFTDREGKNRVREDIEEMDFMPFAAMTPIIQTHRFFGRSLADLVMEIQRIKTALLRGLLDNTYLRNNARPEVAEDSATPETLDDLLVARLGAPIRVKRSGGINWQETPDVSATTLPLMDYMDQIREQRTGVTRAGQGLDASTLQNQSATVGSQIFTMAQSRMKLIARIFAETGLKDLFMLLHGIIRKHGQQAQTVRLRNKWVAVDPRNWKTRNDLTVHLGLSAGSKPEQIQQTMALANFQKELLLGGKSNMVSDKNLFATCKRLTKLMGGKDSQEFFTDPATVPPPPPPAPDPKLQIEQMKQQGDQQKMQTQAQLDQQKMAIDTQHQAAKNAAEAALAEKKFQLERELKIIDAQLKVEQANREHQYKLAELGMKAAGDQQKHDLQAADTGARHAETNATNSNFKTLANHVALIHQQHGEVLKALNAPKKHTAIRDPKTGKLVGTTVENLHAADTGAPQAETNATNSNFSEMLKALNAPKKHTAIRDAKTGKLVGTVETMQ